MTADDALAVDLLDEARALVTHAGGVLARTDRVSGVAWANLTVALTTLGRDVRPDVVEVTDL